MELGKTAPNFCATGIDEGEKKLEDYKGKWLVLYFYPRDNTSGCTLEAKEFSDLKSEFEKLGAVIVGVSKDSVKSHKNFIEKHGLTVELLSDPDHELLETFQAWGEKKMYGKTSMGTIRSTVILNPQQEVVFHFPKVKASGHAAEVLEKLKELQV